MGLPPSGPPPDAHPPLLAGAALGLPRAGTVGMGMGTEREEAAAAPHILPMGTITCPKTKPEWSLAHRLQPGRDVSVGKGARNNTTEAVGLQPQAPSTGRPISSRRL